MIASLVERLIRSQGWLEPFGGWIQNLVSAIYKPLGAPGQRLKSFLHGAWLGHALHPVITDVPLGAWTVAIIADLVALTGRVSPAVGDLCVFIGLLAALAAVVTGYNDHHETYGWELRVATAHGLTMTLVTLIYLVSFLMRWLGGPAAHGTAVALGIVGYVIVLGGAYLGGDLAFGLGTMVNRNAFAEGPERDYVDVGRSEDFVEGSMRRVEAGGMPVLVVRYRGRVNAIAATCSHAGGPLDEGSLDGPVVTCPWHASQFDVRSGRVRRAPATFAQPLLTVREEAGTVAVRLAQPLHG